MLILRVEGLCSLFSENNGADQNLLLLCIWSASLFSHTTGTRFSRDTAQLIINYCKYFIHVA